MSDLFSEFVSRVKAERVCEILEKLIAFPTVNPPGDEGEIASFVADFMTTAGLDVEAHEVKPCRPNVVGRLLTGRPGPTLILNTHMDVVPAGDGWSRDPFSAAIENGELYGRGSVDAKGSLAAMLASMEILSGLRSELKGSIVLTAVVDEEMGSSGTKALFPGLKADMAVVGEPTGCRICIAHKGTSRSRIVVRGRSAHAAEPDTGVNAIEGAAHVVLKLKEYHQALQGRVHRLLGAPTAAVTIIKGGTKGNVIPDRCELILSRRMLPGESETTVRGELEELFDRLRYREPPVDASIDQFFETSGGPTETPETDPFVQLARRAIGRLTGEEVELQGFAPNCDMSRIRGAGIPTLILGPGDTKMSHQQDEHVSVKDLEMATLMYGCIAAEANG